MKGWSLVFSLLVFASVALAEYDCPEDWVDLGERHGCFYFAAEAGNMNWFDAMDYCNILHENAFLAEVRTKPTQEFIVEYADTLPDHGWWLGGTDFFGEGNWRWERTGDAMEVTFWDENQPNNHNDEGETEDCAHLQNKGRSPHRLWNDHVCLSVKDVEGLRPLCQLFF